MTAMAEVDERARGTQRAHRSRRRCDRRDARRPRIARRAAAVREGAGARAPRHVSGHRRPRSPRARLHPAVRIRRRRLARDRVAARGALDRVVRRCALRLQRCASSTVLTVRPRILRIRRGPRSPRHFGDSAGRSPAPSGSCAARVRQAIRHRRDRRACLRPRERRRAAADVGVRFTARVDIPVRVGAPIWIRRNRCRCPSARRWPFRTPIRIFRPLFPRTDQIARVAETAALAYALDR